MGSGFLRVLLLAPLGLGGCSDNIFTQLNQEDFFQQVRVNTVDLLLVVDNSCSMVEEQANLAENFDSFITYFTEADVDWQLGVTTTDVAQPHFSGRLIGGDDELVLIDADGVERDSVAYDEDWAVAPGLVYALDASWNSVVSNDKHAHWCGVADGSPGAVNPTCNLETPGPGADARHGSVIVTEFLADADDVSDQLGEWFEISNIGAEDTDISGWSVADGGRNAFVVPDGTTVAAGASLTFGRSADVALNGGIGVDIEVGDAITMNDNVKILSGATENPAEIFAEMVAQGVGGSGIEMGLEAARLAITDPLITTDNAGFLREDANLSILIVSDEEDSSPDPVDVYLRAFADVKGEAAYRDHAIMNISGVVGDKPPEFKGDSSCSSRNGDAAYGHRYIDAIEKTDGLSDSICDDDFSPIVAKLGLTLSGLLAEFELSRVPKLETLAVSIYDTADTSSMVRDLTLDTDFTYSEERNSIVFEYAQVPESQQYIRVQYKIKSGTI